MKLEHVSKFERLNDIKVNVHLYEYDLKGPIYCSRKTNYSRAVNLLLLHNSSKSEEEGHYCSIIRLPALYKGSARMKHHGTIFTCDRCCRPFYSEGVYLVHREWCLKGKPQIELMPRTLEFLYKPSGFKLQPLRMIYADIECYTDKDDDNKHMPAAVAYRPVWHRHYENRNEREQTAM